MISVLELLPNKFVFPIFKNGRSSIVAYAKQHRIKWLYNGQIKKLKEITIFVREPKERFVSGVHSFIEYERRKNKHLHYETILHFVENKMLINEHFMPQFFWIKNLSKYFTGDVSIKNKSELMEWIPNRDNPRIPEITKDQKKIISKIEYKDLKYDYLLLEKYTDKKTNINSLILDIEKCTVLD